MQHAQVRTEAFKKWFGDWETVANLNWLDHGDTVVSMVGDEIPTLKGIAKLADWIAQNWIDRKETVIDRSDLGEITIDRKAVKDSAAHGLSKSKVQAYYLVPEVIRDGKVLGTLPHQVGKPDAVIIAAPVKIGANNYKMYVEVRHDANMKRMYVHEVVLNDPATAFKTAAEVPEGSKLHSANRGAIFSFIQNLRDVKSSKVVDENGEPLVVYHGSDEGFDTFLKEKIGTNIALPNGAPRGFYFAKDKALAEKYGKTVTAAFISGEPLLNNSKIVVAGEPTQIKSAVANNGNFDGNDANILHQDKLANRGSFNPETLTIALLKDANYSTFLHETGHFFLETQFALASQLDKMAEDLGLDMLSEGEKGILNDTNALLKWFGVSDLNTWFAMNLDEKRSYHEQFARGFEAYLYEGKAPSIELAPLFQRFADWLKRVYQDIKSLNVTLNDEVRSVFDRMLASDAEIAQAKQARSMMALFAKQEDSPMSPEEFAEYQDVLTRWTDTAQEQLQSRLLRDLVWLGKAKPKVLKALQKEAKEKRRELRMGIKTQVMSE